MLCFEVEVVIINNNVG